MKSRQTLINLKNHSIFGVWNWRMIQIGKNQDAIVPLFFKELYTQTRCWYGYSFEILRTPPAAKTVPIGETSKRGRLVKAKPALLVQ